MCADNCEGGGRYLSGLWLPYLTLIEKDNDNIDDDSGDDTEDDEDRNVDDNNEEKEGKNGKNNNCHYNSIKGGGNIIKGGGNIGNQEIINKTNMIAGNYNDNADDNGRWL